MHKRTDQLLCGDFVEIPFTSAATGDLGSAFVVKNVTKDKVFLWRPYTHLADFTYTGGVICYAGINEVTLERGPQTIDVVKQSKIKDAQEHNDRLDEIQSN